MKPDNFEKRSVRRANKKRYKKRIISVIAISAVAITAFAMSKNISADNKQKSSNVSVELNVEKLERDKVQIELENFTPVIKSLQLSLKIDGNAKFREDSIKWLVESSANEGSSDLKTHVKMSSDKKSMDIFIVSSEPLVKNGGTIEICEVNVDKDSVGKSAYSIEANVNADGVAYSYVINDTNRQVSGIDMANLSEEKLTINSAPVISLKSSPAIVDGNIIVSKDDTFDAKSYIEVNDEEDGEISLDNVTVTGKVDTKKVGTYSIKYSVTDSEGDEAVLEQTVIVEEVNIDDVTPPTIIVNNNGQEDGKLVITEGEIENLLDLISAVDYLGRDINVNIEGNYDLNVAGEYNITIVATDRFGNESKKDIVLTVEKAPVDPDQPVDPEQPEQPEEPGQPEQPEQPEQPGEPDTPSDENPGDNEGDQDSNNPIIPDDSGSTNDTENNGTNNNTNNNNTNNNTSNNNTTNSSSDKQNGLPKTGEGIFYGVVVAIAAAIIGSGIYLVTKKKK